MTLSWPSFLASATSALIPPQADTLSQVVKLTPLAALALLELPEPLVPALLAAVVLDELAQAAVISTEVAITAPAAITCRACKVFPPRPLPPFPGGRARIVG